MSKHRTLFGPFFLPFSFVISCIVSSARGNLSPQGENSTTTHGMEIPPVARDSSSFFGSFEKGALLHPSFFHVEGDLSSPSQKTAAIRRLSDLGSKERSSCRVFSPRPEFVPVSPFPLRSRSNRFAVPPGDVQARRHEGKRPLSGRIRL